MTHTYFKLNEDDILSIVKDYLLQQLPYEQSQGSLGFVQSTNDEIHLVAAFSNSDDDSIQSLDLKELASSTELNGPVSSLTDSQHISLHSPEAQLALQRLLKKLESEID